MSVINRERFYAALAEIDDEKNAFAEKIAAEQAKIDEDFNAKMYVVHTYGSKYGEDIRDYCAILHELSSRGARVSCCCYLPTSVDGTRLDYVDDTAALDYRDTAVNTFNCRCGIMFIDNETKMSIYVYPSTLENDLRCAFDIVFMDDNAAAKFEPIVDNGVKSYAFDGFMINGKKIDKYDNLDYWHRLWYTFSKVQDITPTLLVQLNEKFIATVNTYSDRFLADGKNELKKISSKVAAILTVPKKFNKGVTSHFVPADEFDVDMSDVQGNMAVLPISGTYHIDDLSVKPSSVSSVTGVSLRGGDMSPSKLTNNKKETSVQEIKKVVDVSSKKASSVHNRSSVKSKTSARSVPSVPVASSSVAKTPQMEV